MTRVPPALIGGALVVTCCAGWSLAAGIGAGLALSAFSVVAAACVLAGVAVAILLIRSRRRRTAIGEEQ